jgi:hypothetical protein
MGRACSIRESEENFIKVSGGKRKDEDNINRPLRNMMGV